MAWTTPPTYSTGFANRMTAAIANAQLRDNLNYLYRNFVRKTAQESLASNTTFQDDNHLLLPLAASETWEWELLLLYEAATAGDIKIAFTVPSGATGAWGVLGANVTTATNVNVAALTGYGDANTVSLGATANVDCAFVSGIVVNSTNAGNLTLRWAQVASSATNTTVHANSYILGYRIT